MKTLIEKFNTMTINESQAELCRKIAIDFAFWIRSQELDIYFPSTDEELFDQFLEQYEAF